MKPSRIRILIVEENPETQRALADFLSADALMEIVGCRRASETGAQTGAAEVALLGLLDDDAINRQNLRQLKGAGLQIVALARAGGDAARYRDLVSDTLVLPADGAKRDVREPYTHLKYKIRNARLTRAVEMGGFRGAWRVFPGEGQLSPLPSPAAPRKSDIRLIAIGASAGGTQALMELIPALPPDMPAIALVQHMPEAFVPLFAAHLQEKSRMRVRLAAGGERLEQGSVYLTALDRHLAVVLREGEARIACEEGEGGGIRPCVDRLFASAAALGPKAIGVILTGMGADGAKGLLAMRKAGAYTIGQDEKSCVVYGMPRAAYKMGAVARQLPLRQIAPELQRRVFSRERSENDARS